MRSLASILFFITGIAANTALATQLAGEWQTETGRTLRLFDHDEKFIGSSEIQYVDDSGRPTGEKIEYFYQFEKQITQNNGQLNQQGQLETFDSHYNCYLKNGAAEVHWINDNLIDLILPKITFKVEIRYADREYYENRPIYCQDYEYTYICGWRREKVIDRTPLGRECIITSSNPVGVTLRRVSDR